MDLFSAASSPCTDISCGPVRTIFRGKFVSKHGDEHLLFGGIRSGVDRETKYENYCSAKAINLLYFMTHGRNKLKTIRDMWFLMVGC